MNDPCGPVTVGVPGECEFTANRVRACVLGA